MSKNRHSVSLSPTSSAYISQDGVNASGLVDQLLQNHIAGGDNDREILLLRRDQLETDLANLYSQIERKEAELELVRSRLEETDDQVERIVAQAHNTLEPHMLTEDNEAVQNWAGKANLDPAELLDRLGDLQDNGAD